MRAGAPDVADFLALAAQRLLHEPPVVVEPHASLRGDHTHNPGDLATPRPNAPAPAAVLVPVVAHPDGATVLFTERASGLRNHSGQVAFPGGRMDAEDPTPLDAALREAEEEIGLDRAHVRPIGYLDPYLSSSNYLITPVVGLVAPGFALTLNPGEVADAFEVPLGFLMDSVNHQLHSREWKGTIRRYYAIPFGERYIWGVTAGIVRNLHERLYAP